MNKKVIFSVGLLAALTSQLAMAEQVVVEEVTNRAKVALYRPETEQPRCPNCATVGVVLHETMAVGAPRISRVTANFRGQQTILSAFHATQRCPGSPAVSDETFTLELPFGRGVDPVVELVFEGRNCMHPGRPACRELREMGRLKVRALDLVNLQPTSEREAVRALLGESRRACNPALPAPELPLPRAVR
jgi:hypothetical protein